ncbi:MAG: ABC transporter permease, partial [Clostridia bacterium]|nr:ABC transporter permease [Clostridia bacterium]
MKHIGRIYMAIIFAVMYIPLLVMVLFSFNSSNSTASFEGFSLYWYEELFYNIDAMEALKNTLILALATTVVATALGTVAAVGIYNIRNKWIKSSVLSVTNIPMMSPEIVIGVSLMLLFAFVGRLAGSSDSFGFGTMLIAHV